MNSEFDIIENSLTYGLYCAENDLMRSLALIDNKAKYVTESSEYQVLNEALRDVIRQYLGKVCEQISKAFERFTQVLGSAQVKRCQKLIEDNKDLLNTNFTMLYPEKFEVPDIDRWNNNIFNVINNKFPEFNTGNYNGWKSSGALDNEEAFIKQAYPEISNIGDPKKDLATNLHETIFKPSTGQKADSALVNKFVEFVNDYKSQIDIIRGQIDKVNNSNKNIDTYLASITAANEAYLGSDTILSMLSEAENDQNSTNTQAPAQNASEPPKIDTSNVENKFRDASDPTGQNAQNKEGDKDRQYIVTFFKANTKVLSAEMRICDNIRRACTTVINNYINIQRKNKGLKNRPAEENTENQSANQTVPTVKI